MASVRPPRLHALGSPPTRLRGVAQVRRLAVRLLSRPEALALLALAAAVVARQVLPTAEGEDTWWV